MKKSIVKSFILALCITTLCALILPTTPAKANTLVEVENTVSNYSLLDFYTELDQEEVVENNIVDNGIETVKEMTKLDELGNLFFGSFIHFIDLKLLPLIVNFNHFFIL